VSLILVAYATTFGNTRRMAEAVAEGARSVPDTSVRLLSAPEVTMDDVRAADALVVGSPMRHRNPDARVQQLNENVFERLWLADEMVGKVGGVFTVGGGYGDMGAGCEQAQMSILAAMAAGGMILVTYPKTTPGFAVTGMHWGPAARSGGPGMEPLGVSDEMLRGGFHHGANVARVSAALRRGAGAEGAAALFARGNQAPSPEAQASFARMRAQFADGKSAPPM